MCVVRYENRSLIVNPHIDLHLYTVQSGTIVVHCDRGTLATRIVRQINRRN